MTTHTAEYHKARREKFLAAGLCSCGRTRKENHRYCATCIETHKRWHQKRTTINKASGLCMRCSEPVELTSSYCEKCKAYKREQRQELKQLVLNAYGNKCTCCGEANNALLSIDHINNDGAVHRKEIGSKLYEWLKKQKWPIGFQVLCFSCNHGKEINNGVCPHEDSRPYFTQGVAFDQPSSSNFFLTNESET